MTTASTTSSNFAQLVNRAPVECSYCHQPLKQTTITVFGKTYHPPCFASCGCQRAVDEAEGKHLSPDERRRESYRKAGIGELYLDAQLTDMEPLETLKAGKGLFVTGEIGTGKTYFASALAKQMIDRGKTVKFETMVGMLRELRDSFAGVPTSALDNAMKCDLLVLDDLGKEKPTDYALSILFELVDYRYSNKLPIIATSNYQGGELVERMSAGNSTTGAAIVSRLHEVCDAVVLDGTDRRF